MARRFFAPTCSDPDNHGGECDCAWAEEKLVLVPPAFRTFVKTRYEEITVRAERNTWLRELVTTSHAAQFRPALFAWTSNPDIIPKTIKYIDISRYMTEIVDSSDSDIKELAHQIACSEIWIIADVAKEIMHHPRLEPRLRRYLWKAARQKKEMWAFSLGQVGGRNCRQRAVSNMTVRHRKEQLEAQQEWSSRTTVTLPDGKEIELSKLTAQNKKNRLAEIITVTKGMEAEGKKQGLQAVFITLTAPPRFHPNPSTGAKSWDGSTPEKGKKWLTSEWARTRARLAKSGIQTPGVRATEAHADGCPHMHMMLWARPDQVDQVEQEFRKSPGWDEEAGAKFVVIESGEGRASASSYVLKYIMKTLSANGSNDVDRDDAWRSTWSVRAVQFFGIPTFDLWRTLRKSKPEEVLDADPIIAAARAAAIGGRYSAFLELCGGLNIKKSDRPLQVQTEKNETQTIKKIFSFETLGIVIARIKATITTTQKSKVTLIHNYPRKPETENQKSENPASPPPSTAPPIGIPAFA